MGHILSKLLKFFERKQKGILPISNLPKKTKMVWKEEDVSINREYAPPIGQIHYFDFKLRENAKKN